MSDETLNDVVRFATPDDASKLAALAREELPSMSFLHEEERWRSAGRFGSGSQVRTSWTLSVWGGGNGLTLIGFVWVDDAMFVDLDIVEPWWCINAIAIAPKYRERRRAAALVSEVERMAGAAGASLLYGQSVPSAVPFWTNLDYIVAADGEAVRSSIPARFANGEVASLSFSPGPGDRWFVKPLPMRPDARGALLLPESLISFGG